MLARINFGKDWNSVQAHLDIDLPEAPRIGDKLRVDAMVDKQGTVQDIVWDLRQPPSGPASFFGLAILVG